MEINTLKAAGLALALALVPAASHAVEIVKTENAKVDFGARFQVQGVFENSISTDTIPNAAGGNNRDYTRIFLFQPENRLKLDAVLDGMTFKFENAMGSEAYAGGNNLYDLLELSGEFPVAEGFSVVAGLSKMPDNNASASYEENLVFTAHSQLFNMFFNKGYDTAVFAKYRVGLFDTVVGTEQGAPNLPQRYIPERLMMPVPVFIRVGVGNITDDPARFKQQGFEKTGATQWAIHANAFAVGDSNAGHGDLFGNMATQAEATKGPFVNGNFMMSKSYNPFQGYTTGDGGQAQSNAKFWMAGMDSQLRLPMGDNHLVFGAQWQVAQYANMDMNDTIGTYTKTFSAVAVAGKTMSNGAPMKAGSYTGSTTQPVINGQVQNFGMITNQGGELYAAYEAPKWWAATRLDVLLPDAAMTSPAVTYTDPATKLVYNVANTSIFNSDPIYELTFPALGVHLNKFAKLTCELEHNFQAVEAIDTDGIYQLKTVPVEASLGVFKRNPYQMTGRMMFQVAF